MGQVFAKVLALLREPEGPSKRSPWWIVPVAAVSAASWFPMADAVLRVGSMHQLPKFYPISLHFFTFFVMLIVLMGIFLYTCGKQESKDEFGHGLVSLPIAALIFAGTWALVAYAPLQCYQAAETHQLTTIAEEKVSNFTNNDGVVQVVSVTWKPNEVTTCAALSVADYQYSGPAIGSPVTICREPGDPCVSPEDVSYDDVKKTWDSRAELEAFVQSLPEYEPPARGLVSVYWVFGSIVILTYVTVVLCMVANWEQTLMGCERGSRAAYV